MRRLARTGLWILLGLSLMGMAVTFSRLVTDPTLKPVVERGAEEFGAALDREVARTATEAAVAERLGALLRETPRNWLAIEAVEGIAAERGLILPADLMAARKALWDQDSGVLAVTGDCLSCAWDIATCSLSNALICNAPVTISPLGDVVGVSKAGLAFAAGGDVDELDLALSVVGLAATATFIVSGGGSGVVKAGAGLIKTARGMRLLSGGLETTLLTAARAGVRWDALLRWDTISDPARLLRPAAIRPLTAIAADLGRVNARMDPARTLHLLRYIDTSADARRIAHAAEVMGPRVVGRLEFLGKARFMRLGLRFSRLTTAVMGSLIGVLTSAALLVGSVVQGMFWRGLKGGLRRVAGRRA